eukprot:1218181-Rhodomonas_salina.1
MSLRCDLRCTELGCISETTRATLTEGLENRIAFQNLRYEGVRATPGKVSLSRCLHNVAQDLPHAPVTCHQPHHTTNVSVEEDQ